MTAAEMDIVIGAEVQGAVTGLKKVETQIVKTGQQADKFTKKAGKDFTGLSRVIQDLPYGFNAISNNLTQLLPAAGAAGLAFSVIVSAVTLAQIGFGAWTRGLTDNKKALEDNAEAQKALYADAGKGIADVITLTNAAKNLNLSMTERLAAVRKLQEEYPNYFGNLSKEEILNGKVASAVQGVTKALFNRAVVRQKESDLAPIAAELFDLQEQKKVLELQQAALKRQAALTRQTRTAGGITSRLAGVGSKDNKAVQDVTNSIIILNAKISPLKHQFDDIADAIGRATEEAGKGLFSEDFKDKAAKTAKAVKQVSEGFKTFDANIVKTGFDPKAFFGTDNVTAEIQKQLDSGPSLKFPPFDFDKTELGAKVAEMASVITDTLANAFVAVGQGIGDLLSGKGNFFDAIFEVIGNGLQALGKYLIISSELIAKVKDALTAALGPAGAAAGIAVGIGLIALGGVLKNIPKFASGGVVTSPTLALVGERGPERITPLGYEGAARNMMQGAVQFVIRGQDLYGTLNRFNQNNHNIN